MSQRKILVAVVFTIVICCSPASGQTTIIDYASRGQFSDVGIHVNTNSNYLVGFSGPNAYRNFFVFDLASVAQPIAAATLELSVPGPPRPGYDSADPSENFELYDVVTPVSTLTATGALGTAPYNDLGSGVEYGSRSITNADTGTIVTIPLNASAIAAMNSNHGLFAIGGSLTTLTSPPAYPTEAVFAFTGVAGFSDTSRLRLTFVPEPSSVAMLAVAAAISGMRQLRKRHREGGRESYED
jgi:hypothetical protein